MNLRAAHRASACVVAAFAALHIANHLLSLSSIGAHLAFMHAARLVYRQPGVESALLACVAFQGLSGIWMVVRGWQRRRGAVAWLQAASGCCLAAFLLIHVGAVFYGRLVLGLDTNFYYAAAGLHVAPYRSFFVPYYALAVFALFAHLACVAYRRVPEHARWRSLALIGPVAIGALVSALIVLSLAGSIQPFEIPAEYLRTYVPAPLA